MGSNPHGTDVLMKRKTLDTDTNRRQRRHTGKDDWIHIYTEQLETRRGRRGQTLNVPSPNSYTEGCSQMWGCLEVRSLVTRVEPRWMGLVPLFIKETSERSPSPSTIWGHSRRTATKKQVPIRCQIYPHPNLGFPSFQTVRKKFL